MTGHPEIRGVRRQGPGFKTYVYVYVYMCTYPVCVHTLYVYMCTYPLRSPKWTQTSNHAFTAPSAVTLSRSINPQGPYVIRECTV